MIGYYDIHTHILPGIDDGARDMEETREMIFLAYNEGIRHIIATPHFESGKENVPAGELCRLLEEVKKEARRTVPNMAFSLGNELLDSAGILEDLEEGRALTLAGTRYILVEFYPRESYSKIYASLRSYLTGGYIPIVAHMERYDALRKKFRNIRELTQLGAFFQMNTSSLADGVPRRDAMYHRKLLEEGYIHFLGSDCHRKDSRAPLMKSMFGYLWEDFADSEIGKAILERNPADMLADKYI